MAEVQRAARGPESTGLAEVINTILDKGIVIDAWVKVSLVGIEIITVQARVVVASVDTYLRYADAVAATASAAKPVEGAEQAAPQPSPPS